MRRLLRMIGILLRVTLWVATLALVVLILSLMVFERDLPPFLSRRLSDALCKGPVCVQFDRAAFSLRNGLTLHRVRVHRKRRLGPAEITAGELRVSGTYCRGRPPLEWIDAVYARDVSIARLPGRSGAPPAPSARPAPSAEAAGPFASLLPKPIELVVDGLDVVGTRASHIEGRAVPTTDGGLRIEGLRARWPGPAWTEQAEGDLTLGTGGAFGLRLDGRVTPATLLPLFDALGARGVSEVCRRFDAFEEPLAVRCDISSLGSAEALNVRVRLSGASFRYQGVAVRRAQASIDSISHGPEARVTIAPLLCERSDGRLDASLLYDHARQTLDLQLASRMPATPLYGLMGLRPTGLLARVSFEGAPDVALSGRVAFARSDLPTDLAGRVRADAAAIYVLGFDGVDASFALRGGDCDLPRIRASCLGGTVTGSLAFAEHTAGATNVSSFRSELDVDGVAFGDFCLRFGRTNDIGGKLNGRLQASGTCDANWLRSLAARGHASIRGGTIARVPLFAGLTEYLARHVPGIETIVAQTDARMPFTLTNGVLRSDRLMIEGGVFSLRAEGRYRLGGDLDFTAQARLFKQQTLAGRVARVITFPFSKLMEFRVTGPIHAPRWEYVGLIDRILDATGFGDEPDETEEVKQKDAESRAAP
jgi:hypothetical protein